MKISYPTQHDEVPASRGAPSQRPLILIVGFLVFVALVGIVIWWFSSQKESVTPVTAPPPVVLPKEFKQKPFDPADGMNQCARQTPDIGSAENQANRERCYRAVMIIFGTSNICAALSLDSSSQVLCMRAQASYESDRQSGRLPSTPTAATIAQLTGQPVPSGTNSPTGTNQNSTSAGGNSTTSNRNQPSNGNSPTNSSTNTAPSGNINTNTNENSNSNVNPGSNTNQSPPSNSNQTPPPDPNNTSTEPLLCVNGTGEVVLLQHTNICE